MGHLYHSKAFHKTYCGCEIEIRITKRMVETQWDVYYLSTGDSDFAGPSTVWYIFALCQLQDGAPQ